jgi:cell division protein FtsB
MSRQVIFKILWLSLGLYACFTLSKSLVQLYQASKRVGIQEAKREQLASQVAELKNQFEYVKSYDFVEREARDKLNLQRPGEIVLVMPAQQLVVKSEEPKNSPVLTNWQKWLRLFQ